MRKERWTVTISLNIDFFFSSMPKTGFFFYFHPFGFKRLKGKIEKEKRAEKRFSREIKYRFHAHCVRIFNPSISSKCHVGIGQKRSLLYINFPIDIQQISKGKKGWKKEECVQVFNPQSKQMSCGKKISISELHIHSKIRNLSVRFITKKKKRKNRNLKEEICNFKKKECHR